MDDSPFVPSPRVSVIVPTWNRACLVTEAVGSVIAQTMTDWELIVADDGSTDDTLSRLTLLGDDRIRLLRLPHRGSAAAARNRGAALAAGEWLAFLDSDDLWRADKLAVQMAALDAGGADWSYTAHDLIDEDRRLLPKRAGAFVALDGYILDALLDDATSACICTQLVRRALFDALGGFDESFALYEDLDFTFRLAARARAVAVPAALTLVREHPGRTTKSRAPFEPAIRVFEHVAARTDDPATIARASSRRRALAIRGTKWHLRRGQWRRACRLWFGGRSPGRTRPRRTPS